MSDEERASFSNLILLCKPHHDLVDKRHPDRFPTELLHEWKSTREGDAARDLDVLRDVTQETFDFMLESAVDRYRTSHELTVRIDGAVLRGSTIGRIPIQKLQRQLRLLQELGAGDFRPLIVVTATNVGYLSSHVDEVVVSCRFDGESEAPLPLDDSALITKPLAGDLDPGDVWTCHIDLDAFGRAWAANRSGQRFTDFRVGLDVGGELQWSGYQTSHRVRLPGAR